MKLADFEINDAIHMPEKRDYGIGIVGCGGIVNYAHLPAYRKHGLKVVACYDQNVESAEKTAREYGIPKVARSLEELLADPAVDIVDIAVTPSAQLEIALQAIAAGKHLLCQKPLSVDYAKAVTIVRAARAANVKLAVNQQMRWSAGMRAAKQLIVQGALGTPADARIETSVRTPWHMWPWIGESGRIEIMYHSIHYLDSLRFLFGEPDRVTSIHSRFPGQPEKGETHTLTVLHYRSNLTVMVDANHHNWTDDAYSRFRFLGTDGIISGTNGLLYDYPTGRVDTLAYQANSEPRAWHDAKLSTLWIPDAFAGPIGSLMEAIQTDGEPLTSGADNLATLQIVFAAYRSAFHQRTVRTEEIRNEAPLDKRG